MYTTPTRRLPGWPADFPEPVGGDTRKFPSVAALRGWLGISPAMPLSDADVRAMRDHWKLAAGPLIGRYHRTGSAS
jgi:hypothetical protein